MNDRSITQTLREPRVALRFSQEKSAAKVGVSFSTVNRQERGRGKPSSLAMEKMELLRQQSRQFSA
jgi:putative transcriptional regulator